MRGLPGTSPTSTPSPKKRQLPAIPVEAQRASRDRGMSYMLVYENVSISSMTVCLTCQQRNISYQKY